jgi:hypothetical protein
LHEFIEHEAAIGATDDIAKTGPPRGRAPTDSSQGGTPGFRHAQAIDTAHAQRGIDHRGNIPGVRYDAFLDRLSWAQETALLDATLNPS